MHQSIDMPLVNGTISKQQVDEPQVQPAQTNKQTEHEEATPNTYRDHDDEFDLITVSTVQLHHVNQVIHWLYRYVVVVVLIKVV